MSLVVRSFIGIITLMVLSQTALSMEYSPYQNLLDTLTVVDEHQLIHGTVQKILSDQSAQDVLSHLLENFWHTEKQKGLYLWSLIQEGWNHGWMNTWVDSWSPFGDQAEDLRAGVLQNVQALSGNLAENYGSYIFNTSFGPMGSANLCPIRRKCNYGYLAFSHVSYMLGSYSLFYDIVGQAVTWTEAWNLATYVVDVDLARMQINILDQTIYLPRFS